MLAELHTSRMGGRNKERKRDGYYIGYIRKQSVPKVEREEEDEIETPKIIRLFVWLHRPVFHLLPTIRTLAPCSKEFI